MSVPNYFELLDYLIKEAKERERLQKQKNNGDTISPDIQPQPNIEPY